jgi:serine/threonine protein kinase/serine/threonine protein phosphatase PrpC
MPRCPNPRCQADYPPGTFQCTNPFCQCLLPEAVIAGRYRIETLIGMGGMGAVYRVSDTFEIEQVALKILSLANSAMDLDTAVERFRREARYAHQLVHKNIVPVLNFGQDGQLLYLVMPLVTGGTLKDLLKSEIQLPIPQAQRYLNDLAEAIDAIHTHPQQIVHRDIKPSNLLIHQDDGRLVVADFGIARAMQQEKPLTQRGWSVGTEHYVAPEQEQGKAEPASDIYSMGVVAYQMFTGLLPFQAVVRNRAAKLPTPSELNSSLPSAVDTVILRAMDIDPDKRYQSGQDFAEALNEALKEENFWSAATIADTLVVQSNANVIIRTFIPENPCSQCGRENRPSSRFCRHCGHSLDETSPLVTDVCQVGYVSDEGKHAPENEDMLLVVQGLCVNLAPPRPFGLFAVADGLRGPQGKAAGGHEASRLAIETITDVLLPQLTTIAQATIPGSPRSLRPAKSPQPTPQPEKTIEQWMRDGVQQANRVIYHCNADYDTSMASTLTVALLHKHRLYVASIGDSRAYLYSARQKRLECLTRDHTLAANLVEAELLKPDEVHSSAKRHVHYRYLGQNYQVPVDLYQCEVADGDEILLCSDGLWHMVRDERLTELLGQHGDIQHIAQSLVNAANDAGGEGNVSVIVVRT